MRKKIEAYLVLYAKAVLAGVSEWIPGVSATTVVYLTGIYEDLLHAIRAFNLTNLRLLLSGRFRDFGHATHLGSLLSVLLGWITGMGLLSGAIHYLLGLGGGLLSAYFLGLLVASGVWIAQFLEGWRLPNAFAWFLGALVSLALAQLPPMVAPTALWFVFVAGLLVALAAILPGISLALMLVLLGRYAALIDAAYLQQWSVLGLFAAGFLVGVGLFARLGSWLLVRFRMPSIAFLAGSMLGGASLLWPWKTPIYKLSEKGHEIFTLGGQAVVQGYQYHLPVALDMRLGWLVIFFFVGIVTIVVVRRLASRNSAQEPDPFAHPDF